MKDHAEDDADKSTKKPKSKIKHRDDRTADLEEEGDSAHVFAEDDTVKNTTKKKRKNKKSRRDGRAADDLDEDDRHGEGDCAHSLVGLDAAEEEVEERTKLEEGGGEKDKKKKKKKAKKKDKKRKRDDDDGVGNDDDSTSHQDDNDASSRGDEKRSSKAERKMERRSKKDERRRERRILSRKEMDERVVASSAIEYYPDDLKRHSLQSNDTSPSGDVTGRDDSLNGKRGRRASPSLSGHGTKGDNAASEVEGEDAEEGAVAEGVEAATKAIANGGGVTLLLFYQYVEPPWDEVQFCNAYEYATNEASRRGITGRMRIAREGMNCTLTGSPADVRGWCGAMRSFDGGRSRIDPMSGTRRTEFADTEFKLTDDLPPRQRFPNLHAFEVVELVNYGLAGSRAPDLYRYGGTHLEPEDYHVKMCESDTVIIDVRNHYEANIGRFYPPAGGATVIDPMMRKSTGFPLWLDKKETKEMLRGKQVLMYCTGGVR
jgi:hypothetical protein